MTIESLLGSFIGGLISFFIGYHAAKRRFKKRAWMEAAVEGIVSRSAQIVRVESEEAVDFDTLCNAIDPDFIIAQVLGKMKAEIGSEIGRYITVSKEITGITNRYHFRATLRVIDERLKP